MAHERMFKHECAHKLDEAERAMWLPVDDVLQRLDIAEGAKVADIGAGTGYFALQLARAVGDGGHVFAIDVQQEMLERLRARLARGLPLTLVCAEATATTLADSSVDLAFLANVWHELDDPARASAELLRIVRPGGRAAILDWRPDVASPPGPPTDHRVAPEAVVEQLCASGWQGAAHAPIGQLSYLVTATRGER